MTDALAHVRAIRAAQAEEEIARNPTGLLAHLLTRLRAANAGRPRHDFSHLDDPGLLRRLTSDVPILEPVKRSRRRKPTLAGVARQAAKAGILVARYEVRLDGTIGVVVGKPVGSDIDMDDTTPDPKWN